jgi:type VI secretion system protein ImpA
MQSDRSDAADFPQEPPQPAIDPALAILCAPISDSDPCGPDLDVTGDTDYLNFLAEVEGILPTSFFSPEDGRPFDPSSIDFASQLAAVDALLARSRDIRLFAIRARIFILNRGLAGFGNTIAAMAHWLNDFWDNVHPRPLHHGDTARSTTVTSLTLSTVIFPLQYTPLLEGRRAGTISYRAWMIATGEIKARDGETATSATTLREAVASADADSIGSLRQTLSLLTDSLDRIKAAFSGHGQSVDLDLLRMLVGNIRSFIDPHAASAPASISPESNAVDAPEAYDSAPQQVSASITSLFTAKQALIEIAEYYATSEPSSPTLPLVRQAYALIGKSFAEIVTVLVPSEVDKAAFRIGTDHFFDLPLSRLATAPPIISSLQEFAHISDGAGSAIPETRFHITKRAEALSLLDAVQRYFRQSEPSSPVPMLCERGRALAEKDFMSVLENVLPKSALKSLTDK